MASNRKRILQIESDDDADQSTHFIFKSNETFPRFLVIQSEEAKEIASLSPFVIEKQIEGLIGTPKSVKKLKNKTLLVETKRKSQSDNLLKIKTFFGLKVSVTEHKSLNTSKGIIRDRMLIVRTLNPKNATLMPRRFERNFFPNLISTTFWLYDRV